MKKTIAAMTCIALTGCAAGAVRWEPVVDGSRGTPKYTEDLVACQTYADTQPDPAQAGLGAALIGGLLGLAVSDLLGGSGSINTATALGTGAVAGTQAANAAAGNRQMIVRNCMIGRGHKVLN